MYLLAGKRRVAPTSDPRALALAADIVIEGDNPGDIVKHLRRVQPEALRARKPGLVVVSITPFGQDGPYAGFEASKHHLVRDGRNYVAHRHATAGTARHGRKPGALPGRAERLWGGRDGLPGFAYSRRRRLGRRSCRSAWPGCSSSTGRAGRTTGRRACARGITSGHHGDTTRARTGLQGCARSNAESLRSSASSATRSWGSHVFGNTDGATEPRRRAAGEVLRVLAERTKQGGILDLGATYKVPFGAVMTSGRPACQRQPG